MFTLLVVGASIARLCSLPGRFHCWEDCTGGIYAAPTDDPVFSRHYLTAGGAYPAPTNYRKASSYRQDAYFWQVCRGRINASRAVYPLDCIVGRIARAAYMPPLQTTRDFFRKRYTAGGAYPAPTNYRKVRSYRQDAYFRQVCRGRIDASRAVCPLDCIVGKIARAAYMPPLRMTRYFRVTI